jgi:hypothetical protein
VRQDCPRSSAAAAGVIASDSPVIEGGIPAPQSILQTMLDRIQQPLFGWTAMRLVLCGLALLAFLNCHAGETEDAIARIREYQRSLGLKPTKNFRKNTSKAYAEYRCYYTGILELPASYDDLKFKGGSPKGCKVDTRKSDVFFYPIEAVATGKQPVTAAVGEASPERLTMVVIHEDLHETHEDSKLPSSVTEAASTLTSLVLSDAFARQEKPAAAREAALFLEKARQVNRYYEELSDLYGRAAEQKTVALQRKAELFRSLEKECRNLSSEPATFNGCPGALNNAGLAFDYTYTKQYPLLYTLFEAGNDDVQAFLQRLQEIQSMRLRTEEQFVTAVRKMTSTAQAPGVSRVIAGSHP